MSVHEANARNLAGGGVCPTCFCVKDECDCDLEKERRAIVGAHEDVLLRRAADVAIRRGHVQLTRRRGLWVRLCDAWHAFWHGLGV